MLIVRPLISEDTEYLSKCADYDVSYNFMFLVWRGNRGQYIYWCDLFVFDILTFGSLSLYIYSFIPHPSIQQTFNVYPYSVPSLELGAGKCLSKSKAPIEDNERTVSKKKSFRRFPDHCPFRASVVCCWPDTNPLPSFSNPTALKTFVCFRGQLTDVALGHPPLYLYCTYKRWRHMGLF